MSSATVKELLHGLDGSDGSLGFYRSSSTVFASLALLSPALFLFDAPHGRAAPQSRLHRLLCVNGNVGWLLMEIVSPVTFLLSLLSEPLSTRPTTAFTLHLPPVEVAAARWTNLGWQRQALALAFLAHYLNRSVLSTFRNSGRSPMHISIPVAAAIFNLLNGYLIGSWLGGRQPGGGFSRPGEGSPLAFGFAMIGWLLGFLGNVVHDEILYALRRRPASSSDGSKVSRYSVPSGAMYSHPFGGVSSPAYLCEWFEWACWAGASALIARPSGLVSKGIFWSPPWLFVHNEVAVMLPRALRTHAWYRKTFADRYPPDRRAIVPALL